MIIPGKKSHELQQTII